jgi:ParB family transcriptional regulator, chromosome partitioning protein
MPNERIIYVAAARLSHHPRNMRRFYPEAQVAEMAASIKARGLEQALIVVPNGKRGQYWVVDGNLRLEGAQRLGKKCRALKCEVRTRAAADQLLTMAVTNRFRFRVDPISEALHYRRLIDEEKYTPRQIATAVGICLKTVNDLLLLLRLEPEIQQLIATEKLPRDARVAGALLSLPAEPRVKLARHMAGRKSIKAVLKATEKLKQALHLSAASRGKLPREAPSLCLTRAGKARLKAADPPELGRDGRLPPDTRPVAWAHIRQQAQVTCQACEVKAEALANVREPAWALIAHAATDTCGDCPLRGISGDCGACPLVDMLRRLARTAERESGHAPPPT